MIFNFEDETTEFKREYTDNVRKEVVAFANTHGGAIYIGVNDKGEIYPIANVDNISFELNSKLFNLEKSLCISPVI